MIFFNNTGLNKTLLLFGSISTSVKGATATSDLEEANFPASGLMFEDGSKPWVTTSIAAITDVTITINLGSVKSTLLYMIGGSNSVVPYSLIWWLGDPFGGGVIQDQVDDIDPILRTDQMAEPLHATNLIAEGLLNSPYRRTANISHDFFQIVFDTSSGNGSNDFLKVDYVSIFESEFSPRAGIKKGTAMGADLIGKFKYTTGRRATSVERFPHTDLPIDLTFLLPDESTAYSAGYLRSRERHARVTGWRDAENIDSWHLHSVSGYGSETGGIAIRGDGSIQAASGLTIGDAR